jgi:large subunit ribosomal protein L6
MSRLAKRPITIPLKTEVSISGDTIAVKGPKGSLSREGSKYVAIAVTSDGVEVSPKSRAVEAQAMVGTYASHIRNMVEGVTKGFMKKLLIEGVGFKWEVQGKKLHLALGFSHPVVMNIPEGLTVEVDKGTLVVSGFDKELVGQFAADVRAHKPPEPYKGKGIRYETEVVRRKQGKKAV